MMRVLERILQEIEEIQDKDNENYMLAQEREAGKSNITRKIDYAYSSGFQRCAERIKEIIYSHMEGAGWIPAEKRLPEPGIYLVSYDDKEEVRNEQRNII